MSDEHPERGEVWYVDLDPVKGHEQGEQRPAVIVSSTRFNRSAAKLVVVAPITRKDRGIPLHVPVDPPEGGLKSRSFVMCDQVRTISAARLSQRWGRLTNTTLEKVSDLMRVVLDL